METLESLIADLEDQVKRGSKKSRAKTFRRIVDLYFASIDFQEDRHIEFFGDLFGLLVDHAEPDALVDLGQRIAPVRRAPARLIRRLANDDEIAVAGPVLSQSERLSSDDLVMLAQTKSQAHLLAISNRDRIEDVVTSALLDRADGGVVTNVAKNPGAEFSNDGFARLAQRALGDNRLAEAVGRRQDVPARVLRALVSQASDAVRSSILEVASPEIRLEIEGAAGTGANGARDYTMARKLVKEMQRSGSLGELEIMVFAGCRRFEETVAALELVCATPAGVIEEFMARIPAEAIPVVCKAADLGWKTAQAVMAMSDMVGAGLSEDGRRKALANYAKLTKSTAQKLLRFWFVRGSNGTDPRNRKARQGPAIQRRRKSDRRLVELSATILVDGKHATHSTIEDISMHGARIRLLSPCELPGRFVLCLWANKEIRRDCEVRWRTRDFVGVQFCG